MHRYKFYQPPTRAAHLLVMPQSKLVVGPFKSFVHAFLYRCRLHESQQQFWFIVKPRFWPNASARADGWITLDQPQRLRWNHS